MAPQLSGLRETLALLFSGISYGRSRDSNEIGGTISIHPVIDELSRGYKVVLSIVCIHLSSEKTDSNRMSNVAWPFGAAAEACPSRQGWIRKKLFEAPHRRENFLVKNVPLPLSVRCLWRSHSADEVIE